MLPRGSRPRCGRDLWAQKHVPRQDTAVRRWVCMGLYAAALDTNGRPGVRSRVAPRRGVSVETPAAAASPGDLHGCGPGSVWGRGGVATPCTLWGLQWLGLPWTPPGLRSFEWGRACPAPEHAGRGSSCCSSPSCSVYDTRRQSVAGGHPTSSRDGIPEPEAGPLCCRPTRAPVTSFCFRGSLLPHRDGLWGVAWKSERGQGLLGLLAPEAHGMRDA